MLAFVVAIIIAVGICWICCWICCCIYLLLLFVCCYYYYCMHFILHTVITVGYDIDGVGFDDGFDVVFAVGLDVAGYVDHFLLRMYLLMQTKTHYISSNANR